MSTTEPPIAALLARALSVIEAHSGVIADQHRVSWRAPAMRSGGPR